MGGCDTAREALDEACDERRLSGGETPLGHVAECPSCLRDLRVVVELERLLASEPPVDPPAELMPSVMALVRADLARARRNARLALAGAAAAIVLFAFGIGFFDLTAGALGLVEDALALARSARDLAPS